MIPTENAATPETALSDLDDDFDGVLDDPAETDRKFQEFVQAAIDRDVELAATCVTYCALEREVVNLFLRTSDLPPTSKERQVSDRFAETIGARCKEMLEEIIAAISVTDLGNEAKARVLRFLQEDELPPNAPARDRLALSLANDMATDEDL